MDRNCENCKFANYSAFVYPCNNCVGIEQWQEGTYGEPEESETCKWLTDSDGNYSTSCGETFTLIDGTPSENSMKYCCYCGKRLEEGK